MAPTKTHRPTRRRAEAERFEARTERSPLGALQPDTEAEFTAEGGIPRDAETGAEYVERIGHADDAKAKGKPR
jgi:hypothetical protein